MKKYERKDKNEKRRLAFEKRNVKKEQNLARYGAEGGSALVMAKAGEFNHRFVAAFVALVFVLSLFVVGFSFEGKAEDDDDGFNMQTKTENGLTLSKGLKSNGNGIYDIRLEAYSTGTTKTITEQIPTDFVLVLDQSGSMIKDDIPTGYTSEKVRRQWYINQDDSSEYDVYYFDAQGNRVDTNIYYKDETTGKMYRVYRERGYAYNLMNNDVKYYTEHGSHYYTYDIYADDLFSQSVFQLFVNDDSGGAANSNAVYVNLPNGTQNDFRLVTGHFTGKGQTLEYRVWLRYQTDEQLGTDEYTYIEGPNEPHNRWYDTDPIQENYFAYRKFGSDRWETFSTVLTTYADWFRRHVVYNALMYKDANGVIHTLGKTDFCDSDGNLLANYDDPDGNVTFSITDGYYLSTGTQTRLQALKESVNNFVELVSSQQNEDGSSVDHRIAITGFSSLGTYNNTEILTGTDFSIDNNNGVQYSTVINDSTLEYYKHALLDVTDTENVVLTNNHLSSGRLYSAVNALSANGGTQPEYGLELAREILKNREVTTYQKADGTTAQRETVVVFFTDGHPGDYEDSDMYKEANDVIKESSLVKDLSCAPRIYSIGVFGHSDTMPLTYAKYSGSYVSTENKYEQGYVRDLSASDSSDARAKQLFREWLDKTAGYAETADDTICDYMSSISSNASGTDTFWDYNNNATHKTPTDDCLGGYYKLATDASDLETIFNSVATDISGASTPISLNASNTYLFDELSSYFKKDNSTLEVERFKASFNSEGNITSWTSVGDTGVTANWDGDNAVIVRGFDYSDKYVAKSNEDKAEKIRLTIRNVKTDETGQFPSNETSSGIYAKEKADDDYIVEAFFPVPETSRYKYTLQFTGANKDATDVNVFFKLTDNTNDNAPVSGVFSNLTFGADGKAQWTGASDGSEIIFEDLPENYTLEAIVENNDLSDAYTYSLKANDNEQEFKNENQDNAFDISKVNTNLVINSIANTRIVTIKETVSGNFANAADTFTPVVYLTPTDDSEVNASETFDGVAWIRDGNNNRLRLVTPLGELRGNGTDSHNVSVPAGWKLIVEQTDDNNYVPSTPSVIKTGTTDSVAYENGVVVSDDLTITIDNVRNTIPIEGMADENGSDKTIVFVLTGVAVLSAGAGVAYVYRKKDEFNEQ